MPTPVPTPDELARMSWAQRQRALRRAHQLVRELDRQAQQLPAQPAEPNPCGRPVSPIQELARRMEGRP